PWTVKFPGAAVCAAINFAFTVKPCEYTFSFSLGSKGKEMSLPGGKTIAPVARSLGGSSLIVVGIKRSEFGLFEFTWKTSFTRNLSSTSAGFPAETDAEDAPSKVT